MPLRPVEPYSWSVPRRDNVVPFLYCLVASSGSSLLAALLAPCIMRVFFFFFGYYLVWFEFFSSFFMFFFLSITCRLLGSFCCSYSVFLAFSDMFAPPAFASSSFASPLPHPYSLAPTFPVASLSVNSIASSFPLSAPPGFPVAPSFRPLSPPIGLCHPVDSLVPSVAP